MKNKLSQAGWVGLG